MDAIFSVTLWAGLLNPDWAAGRTFTDVPSAHWAYESMVNIKGRKK